MRTYNVKMSRVGRTHDLPAFDVEAEDLDGLEDAILRNIRRHLASRAIDVTVADDGRVFVAAGFHNGGEGTWAQVLA